MPVVSGLDQPVFLTHAQDGRRFLVEQPGRIRVLQPGETNAALFLDISFRVLSGGERGLLGLPFHPQFAVNGRFYLNYTRRPDGATVVAEYQNDQERILFTIAQPYENHNGGMIAFGPDGYLYIGTGDGGSANDPQNRAQNLSVLLGKILRINVDIPNSSPEIFAYGFRNPWRFSFDRLTGQLYAGDVGQGAREEIDIVTPGGNYGWRVWEGTRCTGLGPAPCSAPGFIPPIADYANTGPGGRCAIIGGYVYRGTQASLPYGAYVYGDLCSGEIFVLNDGLQTVLLDTPLQISSFGEDAAGEIYLVEIGGSIFRLANPNAMRTAQRQFAVPDGGVFAASTAGNGQDLASGYARIQADEGRPLPSGLVVVGYHRNGVVVSEASIPIAPLTTQGRVFAEMNGLVNTGIAMANPAGPAAVVSFEFRDANGNGSKAGTMVIEAGRQASGFFNQPPFNGDASTSGTFTFSSTLPLSVAAFRELRNERGELLLTTLPLIPIDGLPREPEIIPQFAEGGGWTTEIVIVGRDHPADGTVQFIDPSGKLLRIEPYAVAAGGSVRIRWASAASIVQTGSVRVTPAADAFAIFSYNSGGVTTTATVVPSLPTATSFATYIESGGAIRSGVAIANPSPGEITVGLELAGIAASVSLPANGQTSFFLSEVPEFAGLPVPFQGIVRMNSASPFALASLRSRTNQRGEFLATTIMPMDESGPAAGSELSFPDFGEGVSYSLQLIFYGRATSGTIYFLDSTGNPASLLFR